MSDGLMTEQQLADLMSGTIDALGAGDLRRALNAIYSIEPTRENITLVVDAIASWRARRGEDPPTLHAPGERPRLRAHRCRGCGHDIVHDPRTDETWDLDADDYDDTGSTRPDKETLW